jgi:hypothetical protein
MMTRPGTIATGPPVEFSQSRRLAQMANDVAPDRDRMARQWAMLLHLSTLAGFIAVGAGFIAPIVIWQIKKTDYPELDPHGKNVANWLIYRRRDQSQQRRGLEVSALDCIHQMTVELEPGHGRPQVEFPLPPVPGGGPGRGRTSSDSDWRIRLSMFFIRR